AVNGNVLANDSDPDNTDGIPGNEDTIHAVLVSGPAHGTLTLNQATGAFTYTPSANFWGSDRDTSNALDSRGPHSCRPTVSLTVNEVDDAPLLHYDPTRRSSDLAVNGNVLANDSDPDNTDGIPGNEDTIQAALVSGPAHGTLTLNQATGGFTYTPSANFWG